VKHLAHRAGDCLQLLLKLVYPGNEIRRDTDFLGYEAFSSLNMVTFGSPSPVKVAEKANKAGFAEPGDEAFSQEAA
jgi:hypothetical protein